MTNPQISLDEIKANFYSISKFGIDHSWTLAGEFSGYPLYRMWSDNNDIVLIFGEFVKGLEDYDQTKERFAIYGEVRLVLGGYPKIRNPMNLDLKNLIQKYSHYRLYIDDLREPDYSNYVEVRSSQDAIQLMSEKGCPIEISFDHELQGDDTAMNVVKWMIQQDLDSNEKFIPEQFHFNVHSANPVGRENLQGLMGGYLKQRKEASEDQVYLTAMRAINEIGDIRKLSYEPKLYLTSSTLKKIAQLPNERLSRLIEQTGRDSSPQFYREFIKTLISSGDFAKKSGAV